MWENFKVSMFKILCRLWRNNRLVVAVHEIGHFIAAELIQVQVGYIEWKYEPATSQWGGVNRAVNFGDPQKHDELIKAYTDKIFVAVAGRIAEQNVIGKDCGGDVIDNQIIDDALFNLQMLMPPPFKKEKYEAIVTKQVQNLIYRNRLRIVRNALKMLQTKPTKNQIIFKPNDVEA